jgi:hypothetical protein
MRQRLRFLIQQDRKRQREQQKEKVVVESKQQALPPPPPPPTFQINVLQKNASPFVQTQTKTLTKKVTTKAVVSSETKQKAVKKTSPSAKSKNENKTEEQKNRFEEPWFRLKRLPVDKLLPLLVEFRVTVPPLLLKQKKKKVLKSFMDENKNEWLQSSDFCLRLEDWFEKWEKESKKHGRLWIEKKMRSIQLKDWLHQVQNKVHKFQFFLARHVSFFKDESDLAARYGVSLHEVDAIEPLVFLEDFVFEYDSQPLCEIPLQVHKKKQDLELWTQVNLASNEHSWPVEPHFPKDEKVFQSRLALDFFYGPKKIRIQKTVEWKELTFRPLQFTLPFDSYRKPSPSWWNEVYYLLGCYVYWKGLPVGQVSIKNSFPISIPRRSKYRRVNPY